MRFGTTLPMILHPRNSFRRKFYTEVDDSVVSELTSTYFIADVVITNTVLTTVLQWAYDNGILPLDIYMIKIVMVTFLMRENIILEITQAVRTLKPNKLGIYDMSGNVWEWNSTSYSDNRGLRGGCWVYGYGTDWAKIGKAFNYSPTLGTDRNGFRIARTME